MTHPNLELGYFFSDWPTITKAIPPRMATDAIRRRGVAVSLKNMMPPTAAISGTLSCTDAAVVAAKPRNAVYQIA